MLALVELYGLAPPAHNYNIDAQISGQATTVMIAADMADRIGRDRDAGGIAARAEWTAAQTRAHAFAEALRKGVWTLGRDRAPGGEILARARAINAQFDHKHDIGLSTDHLIAITRTIALAAATGR
jgi:hypothetical protein